MSSASLQVPKSLEEIARPDRCALVVYDMQAGILSQLPHGPQILGKVLEVLEVAREHGFRIVFLRHMSLPTKLGQYPCKREPKCLNRLWIFSVMSGNTRSSSYTETNWNILRRPTCPTSCRSDPQD